MSDHFGTLCVKGLREQNRQKLDENLEFVANFGLTKCVAQVKRLEFLTN